MMFNHIAIVGVGLIGGSFALAARRAGLADRITGCGGSSLDTALARGVIDGREDSFAEGRVCDADLIFLAAPVGAIIEFLRARSRQVKPGAIVTDAGSTKLQICEAARESLSGDAYFVGGHPLTGSHRAGVEFADPDLFSGAHYAIIVDDEASACEHQEFGSKESGSKEFDSIGKVTEMIRAIGSLPVMITARSHDRTVARTSHAPQLISTALALAIAKSARVESAALSGGGLADMIRLAASEWTVWEDICRTNNIEIADALGEVTAEIETLRGMLQSGDYLKACRAFEDANRFAREFHQSRQGDAAGLNKEK